MEDNSWYDFICRKAKNKMLGEIRFVGAHDGDFALLNHPFLYWNSNNGFVDRSLENWGHTLLVKACKKEFTSPQEFKEHYKSLNLSNVKIKKLRYVAFFDAIFEQAICVLHEDPLFQDVFQLRMLHLALCDTEHYKSLFETEGSIPTALCGCQGWIVTLLEERVFESCMQSWIKEIT